MQEVEVAYDSRSISATSSSVEQTFAVVFLLTEEEYNTIDPDYDFLDSSDDIIALEAAYDFFPSYRLMPTSGGVAIAVALDSIKLDNVGYLKWKAIATYKYDINTGVAGNSSGSEIALEHIKINFAIGGGTRHITKSLEVLSSETVTDPDFVGPMPLPPDNQGAIGVTKDGVTGYDVPDNSLRVQITGYFFPSAITLAYMNVVKGLCGKYNNAEYLGAEIGEVLFHNATGGGTVVNIIPITFDFSIGENVVAQADPGFTDLTCLAHDVVDYIYVPRYDDTASVVLMYPKFRYVHRVAKPGNLALLGLP